MNKKPNIQEYFQNNLLKREIEFETSKNILREDYFILTKVGLPENVLNYDFKNPIIFKKSEELIIGSLEGENVLLNLKNRTIYINDNSFYIAKNIKNFLYQLYIYDFLWNVMIAKSCLGKYREDKNFINYAKYLEAELLKIDSELLIKDNRYYWGALIEDIEFGLIG